MPDPISSVPERTVVVDPSRSGILTFISLSFNALILLLLLIGLVCHHSRPKPPGPGERFSDDRGWDRDDGDRQGGRRFHHREFGGMRAGGGWDRDEGDDRGWGRDSDGEHGDCGWRRGADGSHDLGPGDVEPMRQPPTETQMTDHIMHHLTDMLGLTDEENSQIRPVIEQQVAELQKGVEAELQSRMKSIDDTTTKIRPMLTADQQKQLDEMKTDEEQKMNPPAPGGAASADQGKAKGT